MKAYSNPSNPLNLWRYITYKGGESGVFIVTVPGHDKEEHGSLGAAQRARDILLNGPPAPGPAPITPGAYGYIDRERATAKPFNLEQRSQTLPEFNSQATFAGRWEEQ
jgi:hypothetical protein